MDEERLARIRMICEEFKKKVIAVDNELYPDVQDDEEDTPDAVSLEKSKETRNK